MLDALKSLFETNAISEEIKNDIEEAWNAKVKENQMQITAELREEFASKYEHDKANMVEAVEKMLDEKLNEEISEFAEDRKKLEKTKQRTKQGIPQEGEFKKHNKISKGTELEHELVIRNLPVAKHIIKE